MPGLAVDLKPRVEQFCLLPDPTRSVVMAGPATGCMEPDALVMQLQQNAEGGASSRTRAKPVEAVATSAGSTPRNPPARVVTRCAVRIALHGRQSFLTRHFRLTRVKTV